MLACKEMPNADMMLLGTYRGFELNIRFDSFKNEHQIVLRGELSYPVPLGDDPRGNIVRLDNAIDNFADRIADAENARQNLEQQKQAAEVEVGKALCTGGRTGRKVCPPCRIGCAVEHGASVQPDRTRSERKAGCPPLCAGSSGRKG